MRLGMAMLAWYLRDFDTLPSLADDAPTMKGVRLLTESPQEPTREYAFVGRSSHFLTDERYASGLIVACGHSYLYSCEDDHADLLNAVIEAFDFFSDWERRLSAAAYAHEPLQSIVEIASEVVQNPWMLVAPDGMLLAHTDVPEGSAGDPYWNAAIAEGNIYSYVQHKPLFTSDGRLIHDFTEKPTLVRNVFPSAEPVMMVSVSGEDGELAILGIKQVYAEQTKMNEQVIPIILPFLKHAAEFTTAGSVARGDVDLVRDAIAARPIHSLAARRFEELVMAPPYCIVALSHITRFDAMAMSWLVRSAKRAASKVVAFEGDDCVIALVPSAEAEAFVAEVASGLDGKGRQIGVSAPLSSFERFPTGYEQAMFCLAKLGGSAGKIWCKDISLQYLVSLVAESPHALDFLHPALEILQRYDSENNAEFGETLRSYILNGRNMARTARVMGVHKNTLKYRMERIRDITGLDTENADEMDHLALSLRAAELSSSNMAAAAQQRQEILDR